MPPRFGGQLVEDAPQQQAAPIPAPTPAPAPSQQQPQPQQQPAQQQAAPTFATPRDVQLATASDWEQIDLQTGPSFKAAMAAALAPDADSRMATIKGFYPDAQVVTVGGEKIKDGMAVDTGEEVQRIVFTHPKTGKKTAFNPPGMDFNDTALLVEPALRMAAGGLGAAAGSAGGPVGAIGGGVLGSQIADIGLESLADIIGTKDTRSPLKMVNDRLVDVATETALTAGTAAGINKFSKLRIKPGQGDPELLAILERNNIDLEGAAPLVSKSRTVQGKAEALAKQPVSSDMMSRAFEKTRESIKGMGSRVLRMDTGKAVADKSATGTAARHGVQSWIDDSKATAKALYGEVKGLDQVPVSSAALKAEAQKIQQELAKGLKDGGAASIVDDVLKRGDTLTFEEARILRSDLGKVGRQLTALDPKKASVAATRLKGVLDNSMEEAGTQALKGPELAAFRRANRYYAARAKRARLIKDVAEKQEVVQAFDAAFQRSGKGAEKLNGLRKSMPKEDWDDLVTYKLQELGLETPGGGTAIEREFSPERFLTNFRAMPDDTKTALFGGPKAPLRRDLEDLAKIGGAYKSARVMSNPSGTAGAFSFMDGLKWTKGATVGGGVAGGVTGDLSTAAVAAGTGLTVDALATGARAYSAHLMTNPSFVRWLAQGGKIAANDTAMRAAHLSRLGAIAKSNPHLADDIELYVDTLQSSIQTAQPQSQQVN